MTTTDKYEIASRVAIAGLDNGRWMRLSASKQREIFGAYLFGKKEVRIDTTGQGRVEAVYSCCYGTDSASAEFNFERIADAVNNGTRLSF